MVPVTPIARQARSFQAKYRANRTRADQGDQLLKAGTFDQSGSGATEIVIDHGDGGESDRSRRLSQCVLSRSNARYDGLYVLRTNTKLTPLQVMRRYRDLLRVEQLFRQAKAVLATRPIYHSSDMAIRGHVFCSFLALLLAKELEQRLHRHDIAAEWGDIRRDLDRLQEIELEQDGKRFLLRTPTTGVAGKLFQAVGVALPPNFQELPLPTPQPAA